jgi:hypothetical protein
MGPETHFGRETGREAKQPESRGDAESLNRRSFFVDDSIPMQVLAGFHERSRSDFAESIERVGAIDGMASNQTVPNHLVDLISHYA